MVNTNYDDGFRHITIFGENETDKAKLDQFLKDNNFVYEESADGLALAVKETLFSVPKSSDLTHYMTRLSEKEAEEMTNSMIDYVASNISDQLGNAVYYAIEDVLKEEEKTAV